MLRVVLIFTVSFLGLISAVAQDVNESTPKKQGEFYFQWGYNRDWYSTSNIHVVYHNAQNTEQCDFMLIHAKANDKPDMDHYWYFDRLTIPQYDMNAGYFFNDKYDLGIEVGWNHLKYVVTPYQMVHLKGEINGTQYDQVMSLNDTMFHMQHTNGNNYLLFSLVKRQKLITNKYFQASAIAKLGLGPMISYTIDTVLGDHD